ncbi:glycosyltransferase [Halovivax cerinus]|uniref:Glycosyltransferase n=1 Tax=Halovivax cerinus TaxID=1487865 RepID=A0ABD5NLS6_9EURY|nr:glycosyltransferase [Halovivax cerinus]
MRRARGGEWVPEGIDRDPSVSVVIPARNESEYIGETLESLAAADTERLEEVLVVDGDSTDDTAAIARERGATVLSQSGRGIADARNRGATMATGSWLAFLDADTVVHPSYVPTMLAFVERSGLAAASCYCRITGPVRARVMQTTINRLFPRLDRPVLPGFNTFVHREAFDAADGFPDVPNEDTAFSRRLAAEFPTGYCPVTLVESSGRRIASDGLTGTLYHYVRLDVGRVCAAR